jgi:UDP-MurNAc hydroxylase
MRITYLGHAGLFIETTAGSILCDPWFNPAFFGSWFPFPRNDGLDTSAFSSPNYLYISHEHRDHLDHRFLRNHVSKSARVLLPDYPVTSLENELRALGFNDIIRTKNMVPLWLGGLTITIAALVTPSDGPEGDSGLVVDDGHHRIFNQNDSRPTDLPALRSLGEFDAHFLQFSGAIWYPMVYNFDPEVKADLGRRKRANQQARALDFVRQLDASHVFPSAGPPCFLDDDLFALNDCDNASDNIFCDQTVFLDFLATSGCTGGHMVVPGSVITFDNSDCRVTHAMSDVAMAAIFADKRGYLETYRKDAQPVLAEEHASWPDGDRSLVEPLAARLEPLLSVGDFTCAGINGRILFDTGLERIVVDCLVRRVYTHSREHCAYRFWVSPQLLAYCIANENDWVNSLFLSCRFTAERDGTYNEYVYNFFKCLTIERLQYAEGYYAEESQPQQMVRIGDHMVQRRCPHLKADLGRFAHLEGRILTCSMHGWQFDIETGQCLTSPDHVLRCERVASQAT